LAQSKNNKEAPIKYTRMNCIFFFFFFFFFFY